MVGLLVVGLLAAGPLVAGAPLPAAAAAECAGVTVVVDFGAAGGGVRTGCAPGDPASGLAALSAAGFGYRMAQRFAGFVCRIDNRPESDPCVNASPTDAYWSYWHAQPGGSWTYSDVGAAARDPAPGSVEGWAFGAGAQPAAAPPAPPHRPEPPRDEPPRQPGGPADPPPPVPTGRADPNGPPTPPTTTTTNSEPTTTTTTTTATTSAITEASSTAGTPTTTSGVTPLAAEQRPDDTGGGAVGLLVGLALITAIGALGWWTVRKRRQAGT
ncbi:hypothetical protein C8E97_3730 [Saccharothrix australiensis]|uniref:LPXTG-motif cell wall-anchored protein n=1 Tax=Saccharothrix australiensis TaxID=2072 RepID=A0A495W100_9PSEU|nr:hypothetical protein C8E97_3730 [Saccharothrix australiensis]